MLAGQRKVASDGYEVMLFPFEYLYMSQDEGGDFSHGGTKNIDLVGWGADGRVYKCPFYAPCTCTCVAIWDPNSNNRVYTSNDLVHTPSGLMRVTFAVAHDDNPPYKIGDVIQQGALLGHTGTTGNVTGDHTHFNTASGLYNGYQSHVYDGHTNWDLKQSVSVWLICYVDDTVVVRGFNHDWIKFGDTPIIIKKEHKFPWVLYAKKLRNKNLY